MIKTPLSPWSPVALLLLLLLNSAARAATELHDLETIRIQVAEFVTGHLDNGTATDEVVVQNLDHRLRLTACQQPLQIHYPFASRSTVEVRCADKNGWKSYLRVKLRQLTYALSVKERLPAGHVLAPEDLEKVSTDRHGHSHQLVKPSAQVIGQVLKRTKLPGSLLRTADIQSLVQIVISTDDIPRGATLEPSMLRYQSLPADAVPPYAINAITAVAGKAAQRPIRSGRALTGDDFADLKAVVVAAHNLVKGRGLRAEDLKLQLLPEAALRQGFVTDPQAIIGLIPLRLLLKGNPLRPSDLKQPNLISKHRLVLLRASGQGFEITNEAKALESGAAGDIIKVQLLDSEKIIPAIIKSADIVEVIRKKR